MKLIIDTNRNAVAFLLSRVVYRIPSKKPQFFYCPIHNSYILFFKLNPYMWRKVTVAGKTGFIKYTL